MAFQDLEEVGSMFASFVPDYDDVVERLDGLHTWRRCMEAERQKELIESMTPKQREQFRQRNSDGERARKHAMLAAMTPDELARFRASESERVRRYRPIKPQRTRPRPEPRSRWTQLELVSGAPVSMQCARRRVVRARARRVPVAASLWTQLELVSA